MAHFAIVNEITMEVENVVVADPEFVQTFPDRDRWIQTSRNIRGGVYYDPNTNKPVEDQSLIFDNLGRQRKNYAGIGYTYDKSRDAFIAPKPFDSWVLDEDTCLWVTPVPMPEDGKGYVWNEEIVNWEKVTEDNIGV